MIDKKDIDLSVERAAIKRLKKLPQFMANVNDDTQAMNILNGCTVAIDKDGGLRLEFPTASTDKYGQRVPIIPVSSINQFIKLMEFQTQDFGEY